MRVRTLIAGMAVAAVALAACGGGASTPSPATPGTSAAPASVAPSAAAPSEAASSGNLTVWLMNGSASDDLVKQLNTEFEAAHPGVTVKYEVQQWNGIVSRLNGALAAPQPPDVVETGNTQTANYAAAGALTDLTDKRADLGGGTSADSTSRRRGVARRPERLVDLGRQAVRGAVLRGHPDRHLQQGPVHGRGHRPGDDHQQGQDDRRGEDAPGQEQERRRLLRPLHPGPELVRPDELHRDHGGQIAKLEGDKWVGTLDSPEAQAGIQDYVDYFKAGSTGPDDNDETNPRAGDRHGHRQGWHDDRATYGSSATRESKRRRASRASSACSRSRAATDGKTAPVFLGGSNLGIAAGSQNQDLALDWVKLMTSDKYQKLMIAAGNVPNSKNLAATATSENANLAVAAGAAAAGSFVTPQDPRWASSRRRQPAQGHAHEGPHRTGEHRRCRQGRGRRRSKPGMNTPL